MKQFFLVLAFLISNHLLAQHCAPIAESYLSKVAIGHSSDSLYFDLEYVKEEGPSINAYLVYLVAYLEKSEELIFTKYQDERQKRNYDNIIIDSVMWIMDKQLVNITKNHKFPYSFKASMNDISKNVITYLGNEKFKIPDSKAYDWYKEKFKILVFIPFLESEQYANDNRITGNRHECNYEDKRALIFQPLPYNFTIRFGTRLGKILGKNCYVDINSER